MSRIAVIILAAGAARRFRAAGDGAEGSKLLAPLAGKPLALHALKAALASKARPVIVVTGYQAEAVEAALAGLGALFVRNELYAEGMASSLAAGVAALPGDVDGALILLADMPAVTSELLDRLASAWEDRPGALAAAPVVDGRRGNPVLFSRAMFAPLMALRGDEGARRLLDQAGAGALVEVPVSGPGPVLDVDTPAALAAIDQTWRE